MAGTLRGRRWRHKSVLELLRGEPTKDPAEVIRKKARELVKRAKAKGWSGPPFDPLLLASLLGIKCKPSKKLFSAEAQLSPQPGRQLLLEFDPDRPDGRRNYSVCHEIVHTFFDDCYELVHHRMTRPAAFDPDEELEALCQIGASELLMPAREFEEDLADVDFSLSAVPALTQRYAASREAVIRRMIHLGDSVCAAAFFSRRLSPLEMSTAKRPRSSSIPRPKPKMRIVYSAQSRGFPIYLPPHKSAPDDSCVYATLEVDQVETAIESWNLAGFGDRRVEAMRLPTHEDADEISPSVVALIFAELR